MNPRSISDIFIDGFRERIGFLKDHADLGPQRDNIDVFVVNIDPSSVISPVTRQPSMVSFIRFRQRMNVDLPQPEGPIMAMTSLRPMSRETFLIACLSPYQTLTLRQVMRGFAMVISPTVSRFSRLTSTLVTSLLIFACIVSSGNFLQNRLHPFLSVKSCHRFLHQENAY